MGVMNMKIIRAYPEVTPKINKMILFRNIMIILSLVAIIVCFIVNIATGGKLWFLYVLGGIVIFYVSFLNKPLIEDTFVKRFTTIIFVFCGYLYLINYIEKTTWSYFVITIICFSVLIFQAIIFLSLYDFQKKQIIPIFWTTLTSVVLMILALFNVLTLNWPVIVLGSIAIFLLLLFFTIFRKNIIKELKKYFYIK